MFCQQVINRRRAHRQFASEKSTFSQSNSPLLTAGLQPPEEAWHAAKIAVPIGGLQVNSEQPRVTQFAG
jgi:hypothetical protein